MTLLYTDMIAVSLAEFAVVLRLALGLETLVTIALPPAVFRMRARRTALYLALALISAQLIHVVFAVFLGWNEYVPFLAVPSLAELLR